MAVTLICKNTVLNRARQGKLRTCKNKECVQCTRIKAASACLRHCQKIMNRSIVLSRFVDHPQGSVSDSHFFYLLILTNTCQTFSLAPSNEQNLMLTPSNPWPPQWLFGVNVTSLTMRDLLLYTSIRIGLSSFSFNNFLRVSSSLSWKKKMVLYELIAEIYWLGTNYCKSRTW